MTITDHDLKKHAYQRVAPAKVPKSPGSEDSNFFYVEANFDFDHPVSLR